jgi:chaperonin cofactor prefoldin
MDEKQQQELIYKINLFQQQIQQLQQQLQAVDNGILELSGLSFDLESLNGNAELGIYDNTGKLATSFIITSKIGEIKWDISTINNGIYTYHVTCNKTILANGKLSIKK